MAPVHHDTPVMANIQSDIYEPDNLDPSSGTKDSEDLIKFRKYIYDNLMSRMAENGRIRYEAWDELLQRPLCLSDDVLATMLSLKEDTGYSNYNKSQNTPVICYLRSFSMNKAQLKNIIDNWESRGYYYSEATTWIEMTAEIRSEEIVYIRYVGATRSSTPFKRHMIDFSSKTGPVLAKFLETAGRLCPIVLDSVAIYEFDEASYLNSDVCSLSKWKDNKAMHTLPEQALIALLGLPSVLNQAVGGFLHTYNPDEQEQAIFKSLETNVVKTMLQGLQPAPVELMTKLEEWVQLILEHGTESQQPQQVSAVEAKSPATVVSSHQLSGAVQSTILSQATPSLYQGQFTIFVTIGLEMSKDAHGKAEMFYAGQSRSADLGRRVFSKLYEWETGSKHTTTVEITPLFECGGLPFVNLLPWVASTEDDMATPIRCLREYLEATRPYIVLTLGKQSSSVAASGFLHPLGYKGRDSFYHKVGVLEIVTYGDWTSVQIPCFHPGQVQYVKDTKLFYKAMNLTLSILFLTIETATELHSVMAASIQTARCVNIKNTDNAILNEKGIDVMLREIKDNMQAVKDKGNKFHAKDDTSTAKGSITYALGSKSLPYPIIFSSVAADAPSSYNRRAQVHRLWNLNIPDLHSVISREHRYKWHVWGNQVQEGVSYFKDSNVGDKWCSVIEADPSETRRKFKRG